MRKVYPRVCGGNHCAAWGRAAPQGLSPRVRGKPFRRHGHPPPLRSIPACAGETLWPIGINSPGEVYPRVCGGNGDFECFIWKRDGLSPRVRGKQVKSRAFTVAGRSIPACAGETRHSPPPGTRRGVYPRVCGGNDLGGRHRLCRQGLSPRVRGKRRQARRPRGRSGSIPACAGETWSSWRDPALSGVYPRVCGGNGAAI